MSTPRKSILFFFLRVVLIYTLFILPWHGVMDVYHAVYCRVGNAVFYRIGGAGNVTFSKLEQKTKGKDTSLKLEIWKSKEAKGQGEVQIDVMYTGYKPTIFTLALILATPIRWSRRWRCVIWGFLLVSLFVAFRVWLYLVEILSEDNPMQLYELSSWMKAIVTGSSKVLLQAPATSYIVPLFIWALIMFRRDDISLLLSTPSKKHSSTS